MPRVKVCGITRLEDAHAAIAAGADALGFVFYPASPRALSCAAAAAICRQLPPFVARVGLFVNAPAALIHGTIQACGLDTVQLHGDETPDQCRIAGVKRIKALRLRTRADLAGWQDYPVDAWLVDAWSATAYGGTGERGRWDLAAELAGQCPLILAGGLTPETVVEAVRQVRPFAVDVSSGVESAPGIKEVFRLEQFVRQAKSLWSDTDVQLS
ncbi:MAG: phosphoribosylanthranilate isomerase [Desulfuromonas thiophila]|nr:phosphoribosylanthranilate isomerase [Desulfuromonas thiophila]